MSDIQKELDIMKADAAIDARGLLGVRSVTFERYESQNTEKIHLTCEDEARMSILCGHTTWSFDYMDDVNEQWVKVHAEKEGLCKLSLKSANKIIGSLQD